MEEKSGKLLHANNIKLAGTKGIKICFLILWIIWVIQESRIFESIEKINNSFFHC